MDAKDTEALALARRAKDDVEPSWRDASWAIVFIVGGIAFFVWDLASGMRPGAGAGFMLGMGLGSFLIQVPITRHVWRCYRLIRRADEKNAFDDAT